MDLENRNIQLDRFRDYKTKVLVVTDLCARGIDISNVENVINFDFPISKKIFIHRSGRTARAGRSGKVFSFFAPKEVPYIYEIEQNITKDIINEPEA